MPPLLQRRSFTDVALYPATPTVEVSGAAGAAHEGVVAADDAPGVDFGVCVGLSALGEFLSGGSGCGRRGEVHGDGGEDVFVVISRAGQGFDA